MITKRYTIEFSQDEKGIFHSTRINDGFNAFEILGMLDPGVSNLSDALSSRHIISFRYMVDTFG